MKNKKFFNTGFDAPEGSAETTEDNAPEELEEDNFDTDGASSDDDENFDTDGASNSSEDEKSNRSAYDENGVPDYGDGFDSQTEYDFQGNYDNDEDDGNDTDESTEVTAPSSEEPSKNVKKTNAPKSKKNEKKNNSSKKIKNIIASFFVGIVIVGIVCAVMFVFAHCTETNSHNSATTGPSTTVATTSRATEPIVTQAPPQESYYEYETDAPYQPPTEPVTEAPIVTEAPPVYTEAPTEPPTAEQPTQQTEQSDNITDLAGGNVEYLVKAN